MEYVADAHALLWHLYRPRRLGDAARRVFSDADAGKAVVRVPAVVAAEVLMEGRCHWKVENETFTTLKNQGYNLEHNHGHGQGHLATGLGVLTMVALDQVQGLSCRP